MMTGLCKCSQQLLNSAWSSEGKPGAPQSGSLTRPPAGACFPTGSPLSQGRQCCLVELACACQNDWMLHGCNHNILELLCRFWPLSTCVALLVWFWVGTGEALQLPAGDSSPWVTGSWRSRPGCFPLSAPNSHTRQFDKIIKYLEQNVIRPNACCVLVFSLYFFHFHYWYDFYLLFFSHHYYFPIYYIIIIFNFFFFSFLLFFSYPFHPLEPKELNWMICFNGINMFHARLLLRNLTHLQLYDQLTVTLKNVLVFFFVVFLSFLLFPERITKIEQVWRPGCIC